MSTLNKLGFTLYISALTEQLDQLEYLHCIFRELTEFRKHLGGNLTITLLQRIGQGIEVHQVNLSLSRI